MNGRQILINQGKVIGGSTAINAMMYVRGNRRNFDHWATLGNDGWSYEEVLPYFKKSEGFEGGASEYHGAGGPLSVRFCPDPNARSPQFMNAAAEIGYDGPDWDYNGLRQEDGAGLLQFTITKDGKRASAVQAFLAPVRDRSNLTVQTGALVTRLLFEGQRAVGVEDLQDGQVTQARADREVVVSGGAFLSPKLLMLSGIGPATQLQAHGIPVVVDLPGVGQNLQDHLQLPVVYRSNVELPHSTLLTGNVLFTRTGPKNTLAPPDLQLNFIPTVPAPLAPFLPDFGGPACIFLPILVQPYSIGQVSLRSANPQDAPVINPNYLQRDADVQVFVEALRIIREIAGAKAFADLNGGELAPGRDTPPEDFIRGNVTTLWHPVGTCKMGRDAQAVVDPQLKVYGVEGLRVADASVMPTVTSGNTLAACYMIGEKLAELLNQ
jgi:choline dehydrogenase